MTFTITEKKQNEDIAKQNHSAKEVSLLVCLSVSRIIGKTTGLIFTKLGGRV